MPFVSCEDFGCTKELVLDDLDAGVPFVLNFLLVLRLCADAEISDDDAPKLKFSPTKFEDLG